MIVAAVSYLNTRPFIWGISQAAPSLRDALLLAVPAHCADLFIQGKADIALIPVAEILKLEPDSFDIVTDFCISAEGDVDTVALLTNSPLENITTIYLDTHSRTSVALTKVLAAEKWNISPNWVHGIPDTIKENEAILAIGDKVFQIQQNFHAKYDLATEWINLTGLPFVFAAWVAKKNVPNEIITELNQALEKGANNVEASLNEYQTACQDPLKYLTQNIKFNLTASKRKAMELFWEKMITPG